MEQLYITELQIEKVRHLQNLCIPLSKDKMKHLILTGRNGSGKTSVLEALRIELRKLEREVRKKDAQKSEYRYSESEHLMEPSRVDICVREESGNYVVIENMGLPKNSTKRIAAYADLLNEMLGESRDENLKIHTEFNCKKESWEENFGENRFIFAHYKADRDFKPELPNHVEKIEFQEFYSIKDEPKTEFVKYLLDLKMTQALAVAKKDQQKARRIEQWFDKLEAVLKDIFEDPDLELLFDEEKFQFYIQETGHEAFGFSTLSSGYAAIMDIVADIMIRMGKFADKSFQFMLPGIVLIDEIETHLHLELQKKILGILTNLFPNVQFIVSTHSPFILNSLENAVIYDLENHILAENGLADVPYDGIVEGYFQADVLSKVLKEKYVRYKELVKKENLSDEDFEEIARLEMFLDEIPDYLALGLTTEYQRLKLEFQSREDLEW